VLEIFPFVALARVIATGSSFPAALIGIVLFSRERLVLDLEMSFLDFLMAGQLQSGKLFLL